MPLVPGNKLGPYEIVSSLGAGGMGEVYRAHDTRLGRDVALKILPESFALDVERLHRFQQESRAIAAFNHPNILAIHDVGQHNGSPFLVSELLEGESLRIALDRGALTQRKAIDYGVQIAQGLAIAHAKEIVHRDLKPENLFLTKDGHVKILDFGLAKALQKTGALGPDSEGATLTWAQTAAGMVMGTASYMAPEQVRGESVDARMDIFALGAVLYEMLSGHRAFRRDTSAETMTAVLKDDPPELTDAQHPISPALERIVRRCLEKSPEQRFQSAKDLAFALEALSGTSHASAPQARIVAARRKPLTIAVAALCGIAALAAAYFAGTRSGSSKQANYLFTPFAMEAAEENYPAWAPDGKTLAYVAEVNGVKQIFTKSLDSVSPVQITRSTVDSINPFWSPEGTRIYYLSSGGLRSVGVAGGDPELVSEDIDAAAISPEKFLAFIRGGGGNMGLWIATASGGAPQRYQQAPFPEVFARCWTIDFARDGSKLAVLIERASATGFTTELWAVPFPSGPPRRILDSQPFGVGNFQLPHRISWMPDNRHLVWDATLPGVPGNHLYLVDTEDRTIKPITAGTGDEWTPSVSPDGDRIAFSVGRNDFNLVEISIGTLATRALVGTTGQERWPAWSPSGRQVAYVSDAAGGPELWVRTVQDGWAIPILKQGAEALPIWYNLERPSFSPNGERIAFGAIGSKHAIWISPAGGGRPVRLDVEGYDQHGAAWSPDGNWIACQRFHNGKWELVKVPVGGGKTEWMADSQPGGGDTAWAPDGKWLAFVKDGGMQLVSADGKTRRHLADSHPAAFGFSHDGATIFVVQRGPARAWELLAIDVETALGRKIGELRLPSSAIVTGFSLHPNGTSFITSVGIPKFKIWLLNGLKTGL